MTRKRKILIILILATISLACAATWCGIGAMAGAYWYLSPKLPTVDVLKDARMQQPLRVYSSDGKLLAEFGEKRRIPVEIDQVPEQVKQAFLAAEDDRFEEHPGVDYRGLIRAVLNQILRGDRSQGGSTITMQVARNFFLGPEKTYVRKLNEIFLALKIEHELSKDKILELYLNKIYLGKRAYGVAAAAQAYYGKSLQELNLAQTAMIAGLPKAPSTYNPIANPERALQRRNYVLGRMLELGYIQLEDFAQAVAEPITAGTHEVAVELDAPYLAEMVRAEMVERYGEEAYVSGMKVHTTVDSRLQAVANRAMREGLLSYTERHGYRGPIKVTTLGEGVKRIELLADESDEAEEQSDQIERGSDQSEVSESTIEIAEPKDPTQIHSMPRSEVDQLIDNGGRFGNVQLAFVLEIFERQPVEQVQEETKETKQEFTTNEIARIYLGNGEYGELNYAGIKWAKGFVSVNEQGKEPKSMRDVLEIGDLVWVRSQSTEISKLTESAESDTQDQAAGETQLVSWQLTQLPEAEGALVALDPQNGAIISIVGGFDYYKSKFNRAVQAKRQPGSGFKPFIYSAAMEDGFTAASIINDAPVVFDDPALEGKWRPENYSGKFFGPTRLREGIVQSRNLVSIRLLISLGISKARRYAKRFDFDDDALPRDLSLALGSGTLSPLQLVSGFSVFANEGFRIEPYFIDKIEGDDGAVLWYADFQLACLQCFVDKVDAAVLEQNYIVEWPVLDEEGEEGEDDGEVEEVEDELLAPISIENEALKAELMSSEEPPVQVEIDETGTLSDELLEDELGASGETIEEDLPEPKRVLRQAPRIMDARVNYIVNSILRDVVLRGTGRRALALGRNDIGGKTGTSNDEHDAWFNGFNQKLVTSVWVGFDTQQPLGSGEAGSHAALPVWIDFMKEALKGVPESLPEQPEGLVSIRIDGKTGLLATEETEDSVFELFRAENVPTEKSVQEPTTSYVEGEGEEAGTNTPRPGASATEELF